MDAQPQSRPWMDAARSPDERAGLMLAEMTLAEKLAVLHGPQPTRLAPEDRPADALPAAGYVPGVERLGFPALKETDASLGIANIPAELEGATALPAGLATAATWDPDLAYAGGAMIGAEARAKGFNVLLAGGVNLTREPRNGRNFEYLGEDPLLAGVLAGEAIRGVQSNRIVSTIKHFVLNAQETGRHTLSARLDEAALRESDLLAFQIAIERGDPGAVMSAYNRVNGLYASENPFLLNQVLKGDWGFSGWVMSDWGGVHSTVGAIMAGLDQESGENLDAEVFFGAPLARAVESGEVSQARIDDAVRRILRTLIAKGVLDDPPQRGPIDFEAHAELAQRVAEAGCVLLKNDALLPLSKDLRRIAVIGAHADKGVLSGGGSSQVIPVGGPAQGASSSRWRVYHPSSPLAAIRVQAPGAEVVFAGGRDIEEAAALAAGADLAVVFVQQWMTEALDAPDLALPHGQDALVEAVAAANRRVVVVLETGGPVLMPWLDRVGAVLAAWYPGGRGGEAIARILFGEVNPSGRLPMTFPASEAQLPQPRLVGARPPGEGPGPLEPVPASAEPSFDVDYPEGAAVGYRWFHQRGLEPLFPFGFGLSYTRFAYADLAVEGGETARVSFAVTNTGDRAGAETAQVYADVPGADGAPMRRLIGWAKVHLEPGESRRATVEADPRLLANYDPSAPGWRLAGGPVRVLVARSAVDVALQGEAALQPRRLRP